MHHLWRSFQAEYCREQVQLPGTNISESIVLTNFVVNLREMASINLANMYVKFPRGSIFPYFQTKNLLIARYIFAKFQDIVLF